MLEKESLMALCDTDGFMWHRKLPKVSLGPESEMTNHFHRYITNVRIWNSDGNTPYSLQDTLMIFHLCRFLNENV